MNKRLMRLRIFWLHTIVFVLVIGIGVVNFPSVEESNEEYWEIFMLMLANYSKFNWPPTKVNKTMN